MYTKRNGLIKIEPALLSITRYITVHKLAVNYSVTKPTTIIYIFMQLKTLYIYIEHNMYLII